MYYKFTASYIFNLPKEQYELEEFIEDHKDSLSSYKKEKNGNTVTYTYISCTFGSYSDNNDEESGDE